MRSEDSHAGAVRKLLLLEVKVRQRLPASVREQFEAANLSALQAMESPVLAMVTSQAHARQCQRQADETRAMQAVAEKDLEQTLRALARLRKELRRAKAREVQLSRMPQEQLTSCQPCTRWTLPLVNWARSER
ncbi:hypothetical protein ABZV29_38470 [Streptomyces sp. NPDC005236]|uniref:hypothetical protein n=1 Tax=Streptomyces sp. NPDC005236 TaxID=3157028 RepID=UPI0033AB47A5